MLHMRGHPMTIRATQYSCKSQLCCFLAWLVAPRHYWVPGLSATSEVNLQLMSTNVLTRCSFFCYGYFSGSRVDMSQAALATTLGYWLQPSHTGYRKVDATDVWGRATAGSKRSAVKGVCTMVQIQASPSSETDRVPGVLAARPSGFWG